LNKQRAIPDRLPVAKTRDRNKTTPGETKPTILSFLKVLNEKGKDEIIIIAQADRVK